MGNLSPLLVALATLISSGMSQSIYNAHINMGGIKTTITLTDTGSGTTINFTDSFSSQGYTSVKIKTFPVIFGRTQNALTACVNLGADVREVLNSQAAIQLESIVLGDLNQNAYAYRSIAITGANKPTLCANILQPVSKTYRAKVAGTVSGEIWYRVTSAGSAFLYGDVYFTKSTASGTRDLSIFPNSVGTTFNSRCNSIGSSMTSVQQGITVPSETSNEGRIATYINTSPNNPKSVGFLTEGGVVESCGNLVEVVEESATAHFNWDNVKGTIKVTQKSPFDYTKTTVDIEGLNSLASGYHIHKFPVPQRLTKSEERCSAGLVSGHFNPYNIAVAESPPASTGTNDQYEIGDLSGKYGTFAGTTKVTESYDDWNLPMFGVNSVVGRSIVIHKADSSRWVCATIEPDYDITVGVAVFKTPIYGSIYVTQRASDPESDTSVFVEFAAQSVTATSSHNWHVHENLLGGNQLSVEGVCQSTGGHFDPFNIGSEETDFYKANCNAAAPLRCQVADCSGKLGTINVGSNLRSEASKFFSTDPNLPLSGSYKVLERSIVVHLAENGADRYACANLLPLHPLMATTSEWKGGDPASVTGSIKIEQTSEFARAKTTSNLSGLGGNAKKYHIHETTITTNAAAGDACQAASVGGHYNPFEEAVIPPGETNDKYEIGDLSGKYGEIASSATTLNDVQYDTNLPLFTGLSSADKSIVLHLASDGSRWRCSNFNLQPSTSTGYVTMATVNFKTVVDGTIKLRQVVYSDMSSAPTGIEVNVAIKGSTETSPQHNWHIHIDPVLKEDDCGIAQGHYNPYKAPVDSDSYKTNCSPQNPLFCEVGDLSKKHAQYSIGAGRKSFIDVDVPLNTPLTVLGRSIVFHTKNGGADRFACANIIPDENVYTLAFPATTTFVRDVFVEKVANSLGVAKGRVVVVHNTDIPVVRVDCSKVMVYIVGGSSQADELVDGSLSQSMGEYASTSACSNQVGANIIGQKSDEDCSPECRLWVEYGMCLYPTTTSLHNTCSPKCCECRNTRNCNLLRASFFGCSYDCKASCQYCYPRYPYYDFSYTTRTIAGNYRTGLYR